MRKPVELADGGSAEPRLEEKILREFFDVDFANGRIADLSRNRRGRPHAVMPPHPSISEIVDKFGPPDVAKSGADLSSYGVSAANWGYHFGRLSLFTPVGHDGIYWVQIQKFSAGRD
jgi:hypothetical protein